VNWDHSHAQDYGNHPRQAYPRAVRVDRRTTTLADVRVGASAVLVAGSALDARRARRLRELGLRPGATVRVMMRTAGGGRVLGVDNLRIVVDRQTLGALPAILTQAATPPHLTSKAAAAATATPPTVTPPTVTPPTAAPVATTPVVTAARAETGTGAPDDRPRGTRRTGSRFGVGGRRLRLLGHLPGLTALPAEPGTGRD
jgi:ferrous iron transport protein A